MTASNTALILIDHGSRRNEANTMLVEMAHLVQSQAHSHYLCVEVAHMELAEPTLEQAFARCVQAGATRVVVSLFFLSPGRHSRSDIPQMLERLQQQYPQIECVITQPLGVANELSALILRRAREALNPCSDRDKK